MGSTPRRRIPSTSDRSEAGGTAREVFRVALRLGLTSFGGPIAHLGYFRHEYVQRRHWLDEPTFADLVALGQLLPGPASSQVGMAIGIRRAGLWGGLAAWLGFTLPTAVLMVGFAALVASGTVPETGRLVAGLQLAAVAVVAVAVVTMARTLTPDPSRAVLALLATAAVLVTPTGFAQVLVIVLGAIAGFVVLKPLPIGASRSGDGDDATSDGRRLATIGPRTAAGALMAFAGLLIVLPVVARLTTGDPGAHTIALADAFYRPGALVFGGGHVVLPLLQASVVEPGWVTDDVFLAGYGAAQAMPGPLFAFSAYLGAIETPTPNGILGAAIALVSIFLPGALILIAGLAAWDRLGTLTGMRRALAGINAAVVGILLGALWDPVIRTGVRGPADAAVALGGFALLLSGRVPAIAVVGLCVAAGLVLPTAT